MYFFLEVLSLSALLAKQLHLANPKPSVPITPEKSLVRPTFYASALQIVGGYDPTQDGANRFVQNPSLLAEANNGVLSVYDRLLSPDGREALMNAATDSRGNLALGGGDFEIPLCLIIKINRSLNDPTQDKILSNSGRARHIYVPSFHPVTTENINHLLCLVIKTIESAGKNIHARLHSLDYWHDSTIQAIVESLCLENLGIHDVHITASNNRSVAFQSKNWFVWSPKIREIIADLAVRAKRRDAVMHEKEFKSYFFSRVTQEVQNEIDDEFLAHLKQISIYKLPFSKMRSRTRSMPIQLTDESRISISPAPFPNGGPFIDLLDARDALLAGDWAKAMETGIYEGKPLFDLIPLMDGPVVRQCLEKSPFALIAGRDHLIQLLISMVENRLAENRSTGIYRPLCLLVTDRPDLGKDESGADLPAYSSGKSSIINAVRELIERSRAARGYRQPAQLMVPKDTGIQYVTTNALSDYIPKTWLGRIAQFTRRQAPVLALKCIESGALLYTLEQI
ncbi:hypothetical protein EBR96_09185, partial [bacterium]|nr:hypothetical protein [bacterium]